jgi:hypothetical protein
VKIAYADPPYEGQAKKHYGKSAKEVDFKQLIKDLEKFDAWALSVKSNQLKDLLAICPKRTRIGVWCKPYATFKKGVNPTYAWEPVLFKAPSRGMKRKFVHDFIVCSPTMKAAIVGQKPIDFCYWIFELLSVTPADVFVDIFPGSKIFSIAHKVWCENYFDGEHRKLEPKRLTASVRDTVGKI